MSLMKYLREEEKQEREIDDLEKAIDSRQKELEDLQKMLSSVKENRLMTQACIARYIQALMRESQ